MCCVRPDSEELLLARQQQWRQQKLADELAAAIENAELPEVTGVAVEGKKNDDRTPGIRQTRTNG